MVDELLGILAHGDDIQVAARVFAVESLSEAARQIPVNFLHCLRAPQADLHLEVVERHPSVDSSSSSSWCRGLAKMANRGASIIPCW